MVKKFGSILLVTANTIPYSRYDGSTTAMWALTKKLLSISDNIEVAFFKGAIDNHPSHICDDLIKNIVSYHILDTNQATTINSGIYNGLIYKENYNKLLNQIKPDLIIGYDWAAIELIASFKNACPTIALTVDLIHINHFQRGVLYLSKNTSLKSRLFGFISYMRKSWYARREMPKLLREFTLSINHANHHNEWIKKRGVESYYIPLFLEFPFLNFFEKDNSDDIKIMLAGNTQGTSTLKGLEFLFFQIIPKLRKATRKKIKINYYGFYDAKIFPKHLLREVENNADIFEFKGFKDLKDAAIENDIFLVPTNIKLGFRVRIAEGMSYACALIVHKANTFGMPELRHNKNIMVASKSEEFVDHLIKLISSNSFFNEIRNNAVNSYISEYHIDITFPKLIKLLDEKLEQNT
jgi:glycosyltransferase involved in cell wall biosynthesis